MEQQEKKDFLDFELFKVVEGIVSDALAEPDIILLNFMVENENQQDRIISECREYVLKIIVDLIYKGSAGILMDDEENPKGWAFIINMGANLCVQYLHVKECERKKGIAKSMVETLKVPGKNIGLISSISALPFWEKMGFDLGSTETFGFLMAHRVKKNDEVGIFKLDSRDMDNIKKIVISGMYGSERR